MGEEWNVVSRSVRISALKIATARMKTTGAT